VENAAAAGPLRPVHGRRRGGEMDLHLFGGGIAVLLLYATRPGAQGSISFRRGREGGGKGRGRKSPCTGGSPRIFGRGWPLRWFLLRGGFYRFFPFWSTGSPISPISLP
jgi:hypothetical protein